MWRSSDCFIDKALSVLWYVLLVVNWTSFKKPIHCYTIKKKKDVAGNPIPEVFAHIYLVYSWQNEAVLFSFLLHSTLMAKKKTPRKITREWIIAPFPLILCMSHWLQCLILIMTNMTPPSPAVPPHTDEARFCSLVMPLWPNQTVRCDVAIRKINGIAWEYECVVQSECKYIIKEHCDVTPLLPANQNHNSHSAFEAVSAKHTTLSKNQYVYVCAWHVCACLWTCLRVCVFVCAWI